MPVFLGAKFIIKLNIWGLDNIYSSDCNENGRKKKNQAIQKSFSDYQTKVEI